MSIEVVVTSVLALTFSGVLWDLGRRWLALTDSSARDKLESVVTRAEAAAERNDAALKNFISQQADITRYAERNRREAEGQLLGATKRR